MSHDFIIEMFDAGGQPLGRSVVTPDWVPLKEHVHFSGIRRGLLPAVMSQPPAQITPLWHPQRGAPYIRGVRISLKGPDGQEHATTFPLEAFRQEAKALSARHVSDGTLKDGDLFRYRVLALQLELPEQEDRRHRPALMEVAEVEQPLVVTESPSSLQELLDRSMTLGAKTETDDTLLPVFIPQAVVEQCVELVRAAGEVETGGILLGRLCREPGAANSEMFLEISGQIPAEHSDQQKMQVTFTDRTWAAARAVLAQRQSDESIVGWFHSHPDFCRDCPAEKRAKCALNGIFFSTTDVSLHRTMFPRALQVGLLFSNRPAGILPALYGWRSGSVEAMPLHLLAPSNENLSPELLKTLGTIEVPIPATVGGTEDGSH